MAIQISYARITG